jgi:hypothetical protein
LRRFGWSALALVAVAALFCGCGSGTSFNPTPAASTLFPSVITAGSQSFTLFVSGTGFQSNTTAQWNGVDRPAVFNDSSGQIAMTILASDVANPGVAAVTVANPAPGGGTSISAASFQIVPQSVNGPVITLLKPASAVTGKNTSITLNVSGNNLPSSDAITWNGTVINTASVGSPPNQLTAVLASEDFSAQVLGSIGIQTSTPGIASPSFSFPVNPPSNPVPKLTSITPSTTAIQAVPPGGFLIVTGAGFVPGSVVLFNGSALQADDMTPRATGYSSSTVLAVAVYPADVAAGGTFSVTVNNPTPGGGASSAVDFTVK